MLEDLDIKLRRFQIEDDLHLFHNGHSDSISMRFYGMNAFTDIEQSRKLLESYILSELKQKSIHRVIANSVTNDYMGEIGLYNINDVHNRADAYCILLPDNRHKGLSIVASRLFYKEVFDTTRINRVQAIVDTRNNEAKKSLIGIGFKYEGTLAQYEYFNNHYIDMDFFAMLKSQFYSLYGK